MLSAPVNFMLVEFDDSLMFCASGPPGMTSFVSEPHAASAKFAIFLSVLP